MRRCSLGAGYSNKDQSCQYHQSSEAAYVVHGYASNRHIMPDCMISYSKSSLGSPVRGGQSAVRGCTRPALLRPVTRPTHLCTFSATSSQNQQKFSQALLSCVFRITWITWGNWMFRFAFVAHDTDDEKATLTSRQGNSG